MPLALLQYVQRSAGSVGLSTLFTKPSLRACMRHVLCCSVSVSGEVALDVRFRRHVCAHPLHARETPEQQCPPRQPPPSRAYHRCATRCRDDCCQPVVESKSAAGPRTHLQSLVQHSTPRLEVLACPRCYSRLSRGVYSYQSVAPCSGALPLAAGQAGTHSQAQRWVKGKYSNAKSKIKLPQCGERWRVTSTRLSTHRSLLLLEQAY